MRATPAMPAVRTDRLRSARGPPGYVRFRDGVVHRRTHGSSQPGRVLSNLRIPNEVLLAHELPKPEARSNIMASLLDDVHAALRMWRSHPGCVAGGVLTVALGLGANLTAGPAIVRDAHAALVRELSMRDADGRIAAWKGRLGDLRDLKLAAWPGVSRPDVQEARAPQRPPPATPCGGRRDARTI